MKTTKITSLLTAFLCTAALFGCGDDSTATTALNNSSSAENSTEVTDVVYSDEAIISGENFVKGTVKAVPALTKPTAISGTGSPVKRKYFNMSLDNTVALHLPISWEVVEGEIANINKKDIITTDKALLKYPDSKATIAMGKITAVESKETFLANTKDSYIEAYGSNFDSINITEFEQLTIDDKDSFRVKADVTVKGEKFTMTHIISNDVFGDSYTFLLLDDNGQFADFDLVEAITYREKIDVNELRKKRRNWLE